MAQSKELTPAAKLLLETPDEVAMAIACQLDSPLDLLRLGMACKRFRLKTVAGPEHDSAAAAAVPPSARRSWLTSGRAPTELLSGCSFSCCWDRPQRLAAPPCGTAAGDSFAARAGAGAAKAVLGGRTAALGAAARRMPALCPPRCCSSARWLAG